jgi:hypothetical protein
MCIAILSKCAWVAFGSERKLLFGKDLAVTESELPLPPTDNLTRTVIALTLTSLDLSNAL